MNRWQIICPVVGFAIVALVIAIIHGHRAHNYFIQMATWSVGRELIASTNSANLVKIGPDLQTKLAGLLSSPTSVDTVLIGDQPSPIGDGRACSRLVLTNLAADGVVIRLREADTPGMFHVLGFFDRRHLSAGAGSPK